MSFLIHAVVPDCIYFLSFYTRVAIAVCFHLSFGQDHDADQPYVDVGGGSVSNKTHHSLARIPLRWMVRECFKTNTGIMFDARGLRDLGLDPSTLHPFVTPRPPPLPVGNATVETLKSPSKLRRFLSLVNIKKSSVSGIPSCSPDTHSGMAQVGTEEAEDLKDALSPMYDRLRLRPAWWILEILPFTQQGDMR